MYEAIISRLTPNSAPFSTWILPAATLASHLHINSLQVIVIMYWQQGAGWGMDSRHDICDIYDMNIW